MLQIVLTSDSKTPYVESTAVNQLSTSAREISLGSEEALGGEVALCGEVALGGEVVRF